MDSRKVQLRKFSDEKFAQRQQNFILPQANRVLQKKTDEKLFPPYYVDHDRMKNKNSMGGWMSAVEMKRPKPANALTLIASQPNRDNLEHSVHLKANNLRSPSVSPALAINFGEEDNEEKDETEIDKDERPPMQRPTAQIGQESRSQPALQQTNNTGKIDGGTWSDPRKKLETAIANKAVFPAPVAILQSCKSCTSLQLRNNLLEKQLNEEIDRHIESERECAEMKRQNKDLKERNEKLESLLTKLQYQQMEQQQETTANKPQMQQDDADGYNASWMWQAQDPNGGEIMHSTPLMYPVMDYISFPPPDFSRPPPPMIPPLFPAMSAQLNTGQSSQWDPAADSNAKRRVLLPDPATISAKKQRRNE